MGYQLYHFPYRLNVVSAFAQMLFALLLWRETEKSKHHMEEREQVIVDQSVDVAPVGPPPTEAWLYIKCNAEQLSANTWL